MKFFIAATASLLFAAASALVISRSPAAGAQQAPSLPADAQAPQFVDAGDYVYISAQGPRRRDGSTPTNFPDQLRQSLDNIKSALEFAHLTLDHLVYVQVYLEDVSHYAELNQVFAAYFPKTPPARAVLGVARVPDSPLQITAVAIRDLTGKQPVTPPNFKPDKSYSPGILTQDRLFVSTMLGSDPATGNIPEDPAAQVDLALDRLNAVCEAAHLKLANMVFVNPYLTNEIPTRVMNEHYARRFEFGNTPARATIQVSALPEGARIAYTGVAVRDLAQRRAIRPKNMPPSPTASPCVFAAETLYCSAKSGFIPGPNGGVFFASTLDQTRQTMRNLLDNLEEADMSFDQVVSTTIYLDDLSERSSFEKVYRKFFTRALPSQTFMQQLPNGPRNPDPQGHYPDLEQMSLIALRHK
jgi:enamine deaminase RidA (YjgF/YER057c/UK114 family)